MTQQITIPDLPLSTVIPLNSLIPFENIQNNETQSVTLNTILSNVVPETKLYLNNVLSGSYPAINLIAGSNVSFTGTNSSNYFNLTINSTIPNPLAIANVGAGVGLFKNFATNYNFKSLVAGSNISITLGTDTVTISTINTGETNTVSTVGSGTSLFKQKSGSDLVFKSIVAGANISIDTSNPNQLVINSVGGSSNATGQNVGIGTGRFYINNVASVLRFKTLRAGSNILINDSASEITISAVNLGADGTPTTITNTNGSGSRILNNSNQLKTIVAGDGLIFTDTESTLTLSANIANSFSSVGTGVSLYKGFNSLLDRYELKTIRAQDGLIVEELNANEIVIKGDITSSINSATGTNTLISAQVGALTTLKVINSSNTDAATITSNPTNLTVNVLNSNNVWNANRINSKAVTFPTSSQPEQESTLVYRGSEYVTGTPSNLVVKYLNNQLFGATIPGNNQVFKIAGADTWALALPSDSTSPLINFLGYYLTGKLYTANSIIDNLNGIVAGTVYYLNASSTIGTASSSVVLGVGLNSTTLWFKPYAI